MFVLGCHSATRRVLLFWLDTGRKVPGVHASFTVEPIFLCVCVFVLGSHAATRCVLLLWQNTDRMLHGVHVSFTVENFFLCVWLCWVATQQRVVGYFSG